MEIKQETENKMNKIEQFLKDAVEDEVFPGGVLGIMYRGSRLYSTAVGYMSSSKSMKVDEDTVYDLASLTKVLITAPSIMQLVERGIIDITDSLGEFFPGVRDELADITVRHLLTHTSGLPSVVRLWESPGTPADKEKVLNYLLNLELNSSPGTAVNYSDPNYLLLGFILEAAAGVSMADYARSNIISPLGLKRTDFNPLQGEKDISREHVAPTEHCSWRGRVMRGEVHDENCYFLGGVSGQAGLFSCLDDVMTLARALIGPAGSCSSCTAESNSGAEILAPVTSERMAENLSEPASEERGLGWDIADSPDSSCGILFSRRSFGHTGFTGTSLWHDPRRKITVILLTNRVNPERNDRRIISFRPRLHNLIMAELSRGEGI